MLPFFFVGLIKFETTFFYLPKLKPKSERGRTDGDVHLDRVGAAGAKIRVVAAVRPLLGALRRDRAAEVAPREALRQRRTRLSVSTKPAFEGPYVNYTRRSYLEAADARADVDRGRVGLATVRRGRSSWCRRFLRRRTSPPSRLAPWRKVLLVSSCSVRAAHSPCERHPSEGSTSAGLGPSPGFD